jgi:four helix bundle protein
MSRDHRKLRAFHTADALVLEVYRVSRGLPIEERFGLQAQMRRSAISAVTNIVEGSSRPTTPEYCRFLHISHDSARETGYLMDVAVRLGYFKRNDVADLIRRYDRLEATLMSIVQSLSPGS